MKLCADCNSKLWPFAIVLLVAGFSAFLTWLTVSTTDASKTTVGLASLAVFVGVSGLLSGYMLRCLRRHCRDDDHSHA